MYPNPFTIRVFGYDKNVSRLEEQTHFEKSFQEMFKLLLQTFFLLVPFYEDRFNAFDSVCQINSICPMCINPEYELSVGK